MGLAETNYSTQNGCTTRSYCVDRDTGNCTQHPMTNHNEQKSIRDIENISHFNNYVPSYFSWSQELFIHFFCLKTKTCKFTNFPLHAVLATIHQF